ncbi:hypothetical protein [Acaryochloris sp. 'Moss Beach']|uniref:hypothetical protein n=1 Tax=Acaryochloris sp. 'Moss Beach' TaxID=2740837 RepID=UPI001F2AD9CA|nr:hypothetical protein [Acaryochloris sp. 'Moss Beach']
MLGSDILSVLQGEADSLTSEAPASKVAKTVEPKTKSKKTTQKAASKKTAATSKKAAATAKTKETVESKAEAAPKKAAPKASPSSGKRKSPTSQKSASTPKNTKKVESKAEANPPKAAQKASPKKSSTPKKTPSQEKTKKAQKQTGRSSSSVLKMNKPFDKTSKFDAITQIMKEQSGNLVHMDDVILKLYGELSGDALKVERKRMHNTMYQGTKKNLWIKSPNVPMSYILEENSQTKSEESKKTKAKKSQKKT